MLTKTEIKNHFYNLYNRCFLHYGRFIYDKPKWFFVPNGIVFSPKKLGTLNKQKLALVEKKIKQLSSPIGAVKENDLSSVIKFLGRYINLKDEKNLKILAGSRMYVLRALAVKNTKDSNLIDRVANDKNRMVQIVVIQNKHTSKKTQIAYARIGCQAHLLAKLSHICGKAKDIIAKKSKKLVILGDVIKSRKTWVSTIRYLYKKKYVGIYLHSYFTSEFANTPSDILNDLANHKNTFISDILKIAKHPNTLGKTLDYISRLIVKDFTSNKDNWFRPTEIKSKINSMKKAVAKHKNVLKTTIVQLGMDAYAEVREVAAGSHKMPFDMLQSLVKNDPSAKVRVAAKKSLRIYHGGEA
ncbi:hypothetical protein ACFLZH_01405 [Patescibacteria group bacterium]